MKNIITREIIINAKKERIYEALSNPEKVILWFPETLEGQYKVGEQVIFGFGDHCKNRVYIEEAKPHEYFAFRWVPGSDQFLDDILSVATTLVEFRIEQVGQDSCKVTLTESGFEQLPAEVMAQSLEQNASGWDFMLGRLSNYFETI